MTARLVPLSHAVGDLTYDDLEGLAWKYGGTIERNVENDTYTLVGAVVDGRRVTLGPVRWDAPLPLTVVP